jgi:hypothetical protein
LNWTLAEAQSLHRKQRQKQRWQRIKEVRNKRAELISAERELKKYYPMSRSDMIWIQLLCVILLFFFFILILNLRIVMWCSFFFSFWKTKQKKKACQPIFVHGSRWKKPGPIHLVCNW